MIRPNNVETQLSSTPDNAEMIRGVDLVPPPWLRRGVARRD
jgi:hypothetical protein